MATVRAKPLARDEGSSIPTTGTAFPIPTTVAVHQIKVWVDDAAYVGIGTAASPPAASETNSVHQEADTELVLTLDGIWQTDGTYIYVYSKAATTTARISFFG
jgi:hypothetical protein